MNWLFENWWIVLGLLIGTSTVLALIYFRRNPNAPGARLFFQDAALLDPSGKTPSGVSPRSLSLWVVGLLIVIALVFAELITPFLR